MPYTSKQATKKEIAEQKRKCWRMDCKKTSHFEAWTGWKFCLKHFIEDYKYGSGRHFITMLKHTKLWIR
jgi:hypothetical protein